jgi:hypothetical protein
MPTTTNFGWTTPADTDLVKDGAAAIRTLAGNIDTSLVDLKGGTTGQFLSKNSNTDLDFVFTTPASGGITLLSTTTASSGATLTISGISTSYTNLMVTIQDLTCSGTEGDLRFKANGSNGITHAVIYRGTGASAEQTDFVTSANFSYEPISATNRNPAFVINIYDYANTSYHKPWTIDGAANIISSATVLNIHGRGKIATTSAITSLQFDFRNGQTFTGGVFKVYGVK